MSTIPYAEARENLARVLGEVAGNGEPMVIQCAGHRDVALLPADELSSLLETAHLLRSPKNAKRLLSALDRADRGEGLRLTVEELRERVGLDGADR